MKKRIVTLLILSALIISAGCTPKYQTDKTASSADAKDSNQIIVDPEESQPLSSTLIERKEVSALPLPEGGISVDEAADILYTCSRKEMFLPESANTYKAVCIGIVDYDNADYYSFYLTLDTGKEKITVGTHYLVSIDGKTVRKKTWTGEHYIVKKDSASSDQTIEERYPNAKATPNEALKYLMGKKDLLKLEKPLSDYIFEMNQNLFDINGISCYLFYPKLEYTDHINISSGFYVSIDGDLAFYGGRDSQGKYIEIK